MPCHHVHKRSHPCLPLQRLPINTAPPQSEHSVRVSANAQLSAPSPVSSVSVCTFHLGKTKISTEHLYANTSTPKLTLHVPFLYLAHLYAGMDRVAGIRDIEEGKLHDVAYGA